MKFIWSIIFVSLGFSCFAQQTFNHEVCSNCTEYKDYFYYGPSDADMAGGNNGVIIFLHGNRGNTDAAHISDVLSEGLPIAMQTSAVFNEYSEDYIVLIPWDNAGDYNPVNLKDWWDKTKVKYSSINYDKIVLVGFSKGGKGAWDFAALYPDIFAGVMPIMGGIDQELSEQTPWCALSDVPIWAISSEFDSFLPPNDYSETGRPGSQIILKAIADNCTPRYNNKLTILDAKNHHGWDELFKLQSGYNVYEWINQMTRSSEEVEYAPIVSNLKSRIISDTESEWYVPINAFDLNGDELTYSTSISSNAPTLATPIVTKPTDDYLKISNITAGIYTIRLDVSDQHNPVVSKTMTLEVKTPSSVSGSEWTKVQKIELTHSGGTIDLLSGNPVDIDEISDKASADIRVTLSSNAFMEMELNDNQLFNQLFASPTDNFGHYNAFGKPGFTLFDNDNRTMIVTVTPYKTIGSAKSVSSQAVVAIGIEPLPITLLSFTGKQTQQGVRLDWSTTEEKDNSHFEIFRGRSSEDLVKVGEEAKADPNKEYNYYSFTDREVTKGGVFYYQLQSVDYDGHRDLSDIIRVAMPGKLEVYPNPATAGRFFITLPEAEVPDMQLFNSNGQLVSYNLVKSDAGPAEKEVVIDSPAPGIYLLRTFLEGKIKTFKVVIPE